MKSSHKGFHQLNSPKTLDGKDKDFGGIGDNRMRVLVTTTLEVEEAQRKSMMYDKDIEVGRAV